MKKSYILGVAMAAFALAAAFVPQVASAMQNAIAFVGADNLAMLSMLGTTLAVAAPRAFEIGSRNEFAVIAADIIYEGAAVGLVKATGHARPLAAGDRFAGFAEAKADNSAGAAAAINVRTVEEGKIQLSITGLLITDVGQPVYASDDDTFSLVPTGKVFVGFVHRFVSSGVGVVRFNAPSYQDPYGGGVYETKSANYTVDAEDCGKTLFVDTDAVVITLPAIAAGAGAVTIVNIAAFGAALVEIAPQAADMIMGPDITGADDKSLLNTKATAGRGDLVRIEIGDADGYHVTQIRGTWAREA
jgi:hypothetical protein